MMRNQRKSLPFDQRHVHMTPPAGGSRLSLREAVLRIIDWGFENDPFLSIFSFCKSQKGSDYSALLCQRLRSIPGVGDGGQHGRTEFCSNWRTGLSRIKADIHAR